MNRYHTPLTIAAPSTPNRAIALDEVMGRAGDRLNVASRLPLSVRFLTRLS